LDIEVIGYDVFDMLVNFWKVLLKQPQELAKELSKITPDDKTYKEVSEALYNHWGITKDDYEIDKNRMVMIKNYMSDSPSWIGDIVFVVGGESCFIDIVVRNSGTDEWWVMYNINENELVPFLKKGIEWTDENMSKAINGELK